MKTKSKIFTLAVLGTIAVSLTIFGSAYVSDDYVPSDILANIDDDSNNYDSTTNEPILEKDDFVFAFYSEIAKNNEKSNIFFSPFSISTAFSMAYEGELIN